MTMNVFLNLKRSHSVLTFIAAIALLGTSVAIADIISGDSSTGKSNQITVTRLTLTKPALVVEGDFLLANITVAKASAANIEAPSGWTQLLKTDNGNRVSVISYWKIAGDAEPGTYSWLVDGRTAAVGGITRNSGGDTANPIDAVAGSSGLSKIAVAPTITTSTANEMLVSIFSTNAGAGVSFATPSGMTEKYDVSYGGAGPSSALDDAIQASAGDAGTKSSTIAGNRNRYWVAQQIALRAPVPPPPPPPVIAFDNAGGAEFSVTTDVSFEFSVGSGLNRMLIVGIDTESSTPDLISAVTYNGVPMTQVTKTQIGSGGSLDELYLFALPNPASGTHDIVVTRTSTSSQLFIAPYATSYANVDQNVPSNSSTNTGTGDSGSNTITVQGTGSWIVSMISAQGATPTLTSQGATRVQTNAGRILVDTDGIVPAGNSTVTNSFSNNSQPWGVASLELKVVP